MAITQLKWHTSYQLKILRWKVLVLISNILIKEKTCISKAFYISILWHKISKVITMNKSCQSSSRASWQKSLQGCWHTLGQNLHNKLNNVQQNLYKKSKSSTKNKIGKEISQEANAIDPSNSQGGSTMKKSPRSLSFPFTKSSGAIHIKKFPPSVNNLVQVKATCLALDNPIDKSSSINASQMNWPLK